MQQGQANVKWDTSNRVPDMICFTQPSMVSHPTSRTQGQSDLTMPPQIRLDAETLQAASLLKTLFVGAVIWYLIQFAFGLPFFIAKNAQPARILHANGARAGNGLYPRGICHSLSAHHLPLSSLIERYEALLRWRHPERGLLYPAEFLSFAEKTGQIVKIDDWVLRRFCRTLAGRHRGSRELLIDINVSGRTLKEEGFLERVRDCLLNHGIDGARLGLEITEQVLVDLPNAQDLFEELRSLGVELVLDDFGTGYSSLSYLASFPVTRLKIDGSFVSRLQTGVRDVAVLRTVVALAEALKLQVTAEGVENLQQLEIVGSLGFHQGQGFYWGRPNDQLHPPEQEAFTASAGELSFPPRIG